MNKKRVHISFDDVIQSLRWLTINKPKSIFDMDFFGTLKHWHDIYNAAFSLYVFEATGDFNISQLDKRYCHELRAASDWLKFGFHGVSSSTDTLAMDLDEFKQSFSVCMEVICDMAGENGMCKWLRLHRWAATGEQTDMLKNCGITCLLSRDKDGISYDLSPEESTIVYKEGIYCKNGMFYRRTDIRYDDCRDIEAVLPQYLDKDEIIIFGHEWSFLSNRLQIERSIQLLCDNHYDFVME